MDLDGVRSRQGVVTVGSLYQKHETKVEPELEAIKEPSTGQKGKVQRVGQNPSSELEEAATRDLNNKWEIKDSELDAELKSGAVLLAYSSNDPTEPIV